jgi:DNA polymerase III delta prime subunit
MEIFMVTRKVSSETIRQILAHWEKTVANSPKGDHYNIEEDNSWWENWQKKSARVAQIVEDLEQTHDVKKVKDLLYELFNFRSKHWLLHSQEYNKVRKIISIIRGNNENKILKLRDIILDMKKSSEYKKEWVEDMYKVLDINNKSVRTNLIKIVSEIRFRLFPDSEAYFNACSRDVLSKLYEFPEHDYLAFKEAFEDFKRHYHKLPKSKIPCLNFEIDRCFNYFHKDEKGKSFMGKVIENKSLPDEKFGEIQSQGNDVKNLDQIFNAISTKPFVILSGISGTGKTQIARIISAGLVKRL